MIAVNFLSFQEVNFRQTLIFLLELACEIAESFFVPS